MSNTDMNEKLSNGHAGGGVDAKRRYWWLIPWFAALGLWVQCAYWFWEDMQYGLIGDPYFWPCFIFASICIWYIFAKKLQ